MTSGGFEAKMDKQKLFQDKKTTATLWYGTMQPSDYGRRRLSTFPDTVCLQYYDNTLDKKILMYNLKKFHEMQTLDDVKDKVCLMVRNSVRPEI